MVKIIRSFQFVYAAAEKIPGNRIAWQSRALRISGKASIQSQGQHPASGGWYRVSFIDGILPVDIAFASIVDEGTGQEILPLLQQEQYTEVLGVLTELAREHNRGKFLS